MKRSLQLLAIILLMFAGRNSHSCDGLTSSIVSNDYIGNGEYLLTIEICETVSNSDGLFGAPPTSWATIYGIIININGANIIGVNTPSISGVTQGTTVFANQTGSNTVEYGDWGNSAAPILLDYGDPMECWTFEFIVDGPAVTVDIWSSSYDGAIQPGNGMSQNNGIWGCGQGTSVPPPNCDSEWLPPTLCSGSTTPINLNATTSGTGIFSGTGVDSNTGIFDPSGQTSNVSVTFTVDDGGYMCSTTQDIVIIDLTPPILSDQTICQGDAVNLDASINVTAGCTYTVILDDSYGDGWNGADCDIYVNGVLYSGNQTVASCGGFGSTPCQTTISIPVNDGDVILINYTGGTFDSENTIFLYDNQMNLVSSINNPPDGNLGTGTIASCSNATIDYVWTPSTGLSDPNIPNPVATPGTTTTYTVDISSVDLPCVTQATVTITVDPCLNCLITNMTANIGACNPLLGTYETTGIVEFSDPPTTGQLIVEDCNGNQQVFNAPFTSPQAYTITGQNPDGAACDVTAYFTDDLACTQTIPYVAPTCPCNIDVFNATIGLCDQLTNTYMMTGDVEFTSPPAGGTLIITVNNGTTTYDTIINPPFVSPQTYSISGIPSDGASSTITVSFLNDPSCTNTIAYNAPADCSCTVDIGTFSANVTGDSPNPDVLCFGDVIDITSNGDWTGPTEMTNPPGPVYDPGVSWLMYSCPPTVALTPNVLTNVPDDPCFIGLISDTDMNDLNDLGWINSFPPGTFTDNTIYWVPITMYSQSNGTYSYVNGTIPCYELGAPFPVQYLPEFTSSDVEDCLAGTAVVTVNGGLPEVDGSNFTASNLLPATAAFDNTSAADGGTITISGLQGGDMWSFTVDDGNGCPYTVTGGPFPPLEDPGFSYTGGVWCTNDPLQNVNLTGVAGGTFSVTPVGLSLNTASGQITPSTSTAGTYDITYTTPGVCFDDSTVTVTINPVPTVDPILDQTVCEGVNFNDIIFTGTAGATFDWVNDNTDVGLAAAGTADILAFTGTVVGAQSVANVDVTPSLNGCIGLTESFVLTVDPQENAGFNYPAASWCTTEAAANAAITGTAGGTFTASPAGLSLNAATGQITPGTSTPGTYDVTYTTLGVCFDDSTITINIAATPTVDPIVDQTVCAGDDFVSIDFTGSAGSVFDWVNDNTNIGLAAIGTDDIAAFTATAVVQEVSNITVTPSAGNCVGTPENFVLTVNPQEDASFSYPAPQGWCTSDANQAANVTGTAGGTFTSAPAGLTLNAATGEITPATSTAGTYDVTYTTAGICNDVSTVTVEIYAVPTVDPIIDQTVCVGDDFVAINFTGTGTPTFDWVNDNTNIGLAAAGSGNIAAFTAATTGGTELANITVTPSTLNCTGATESFILTVNDLDDPSFDYPSGLTHCQTGTDPTTNITGMAGGTFSCVATSGGPTLDLDPTTGTVTLATSDLGTYDITYNTNTAGASLCPQTLTVTMVVTDAPVADFTFIEYCANDTDPLPDLTGTSGVWSSTFGLVINSITGLVDLDASTPGTYTVTNDVNIPGCALATYDDDITINELPNATISGATTICPLDPLPDLTIDFTAGVANWDITYEVDGNPVTVNTAANPYTIVGAAVGTYDITTVTDGNGCTNTLAGQAVVATFPTPVITPLVNQYQCEGADLLIQNIDVSPAASILDWTSTTDVGFGLAGQGQIGNFTGINGTGVAVQTTVTVTPTSVDGCPGLPEDFLVTINPLPVISFTGGPLTGCEPLTVDFTNTTTPNSQNCVWDFGNGNVFNGCGPVSNVYMAGDYDVTLTVTTAEGCTSTDTYASYVNVSPQPVAFFSYAPQEITVEDPVVEFTNTSVNADVYNWDFGDNSTNSSVTDPIHLYPGEPENYLVTLWAYNTAGTCYDSIQALIPIKDVLLYYVPNIFTPDGDDFNETFKPIFTSGYDPFDYHLTIFNRWGEIVFESYNADEGWNGHYGDGGLVQDGVYVWQIDFKESMSDKRHIKRGHVTVLK